MATFPITFLWCHLRSVSTAFERAFIQRDDFFCIHEPYSEPFYIGPERLTKRYPENYDFGQSHPRNTYAEATAEIIATANHNNAKRIFCKDMAFYIIRRNPEKYPENPTMLDLEFLKKCTHTFLLRNPEKAIPSLYRCYRDVECNIEFEAQEAGFVELRILYDFLTKLNNGQRPLLIDSSDLVKDPGNLTKKYCEKIGIEFDHQMLHWKEEKVEVLQKWESYHRDAEKSTTINEIPRENDGPFPKSVYIAIMENMPIYNELKQFKI